MSKAMRKELLREIARSKSRFISIFIMIALSVLFLTGLRSAAPDMRQTGDSFFDAQNFMDLRITSTLGLTEDDLQALQQQPGVAAAQGDWSLDALATDVTGENAYTVKLHTVTQQVNAPVLLEGSLPAQAGECAIEADLAELLNLELGSTLYLEDTDTIADALTTRELTVTAIVESPLYIATERGTGSLGDGSITAYVLLSAETITLDYYTDIYLLAEGAAELDTFGEAYEALLDAFSDALTPVAEELAAARYESLLGDAEAEIADAEAELAEARADVEAELADAQAELEDARQTGEQELADARLTLAEAREELDQGWLDLESAWEEYEQQIADAQEELAAALVTLEEGEAELADSLASLQVGEAELAQAETEAQQQLAQAQETLSAADAQLEAQAQQLEEAQQQLEALEAQAVALQAMGEAETAAQLLAQGEELAQTLAVGQATLAQAQAQAAAGWLEYQAQEAAANAELAEARASLQAGWSAYAAGQKELESGWAEYEDGLVALETAKQEGQQELEEARQALEEAELDYADGLTELAEGEETLVTELAEAEAELADARAEAEAELADAQAEIADAWEALEELTEPKVYVLGRSYNAGYASYEQDTQRMAAIANVFPLLFFLVAALVCLTTMTRMIDEERTQIGAMKAMGYGTAAVAAKYLIYGALASVSGTLVGTVVGAKLLPYIICNAYGIMYDLPEAQLPLYPAIFLGSLLAALACTAGATLWAAVATMKETPASLMRPRAPQAGKRVFLEYLPFLWKRLNFSAKVSARNLFRYKKRFWMTVIGVGGCTALIITGLGLHDGIFSIVDRQYGELSLYDLQIGLNTDEDAAADSICAWLDADARVVSSVQSYTTTMSMESDSRSIDGYVVSVAQGDALDGMMVLRDAASGEEMTIPETGVIMTQKLSELLGVDVGDMIVLIGNDQRVEVQVSGICEHYIRHFIYMQDDYYAALFGEVPTHNTVYTITVDESEAAVSALATDLMAMEAVSSATNIAASAVDFSKTLSSINIVVVVVILAAAALAFVVLYNLTNINITERIRELATIKVLGFFDTEVAMYVYRENVILTLLGILLGLGMGRYLYTYLICTVEVDLVMFGRTVEWLSCVQAAGLSLLFALLVNLVMYFRFKTIDMVESLKSVE